jgi:hypothetical protein
VELGKTQKNKLGKPHSPAALRGLPPAPSGGKKKKKKKKKIWVGLTGIGLANLTNRQEDECVMWNQPTSITRTTHHGHQGWTLVQKKLLTRR